MTDDFQCVVEKIESLEQRVKDAEDVILCCRYFCGGGVDKKIKDYCKKYIEKEEKCTQDK